MVGLRTKLLIPTLLTAILAIVAVICISILQFKSFQHQNGNEIKHFKQDLHHLVEDMRHESRHLVKLLSNKWPFLDNVASENTDRLLNELSSFHKSQLHDFIAVYDMDGITIARGDSPSHFGMTDDLHPYIMKAKKHKKNLSVVTLFGNQLLLLELKQLDAGYGPIGFLAAGQYLDEKIINTFSQPNRLYLEFQYKGAVVTASGKFKPPKNIDKSKFLVDFSDKFDQSSPLSAVLWKDTSEITARFWNNLFLVVIAIGLLSCVVIFFSRRVIVKTANDLNEARIMAEGEIVERRRAQEGLEERVLERTQNLEAEIVAHRQTEKALRESETKYRSMMEAMEDPVTICSPDYKITYMNPAMINRTGHDATGEPCFKALHDLNAKCKWCKHHKTQNGEHFTIELVSPKDKRSYLASHSPIFHEDGSISKLTVYRDTTDIKKMETQLQQAQKMEAIGTLAGGIAHDFNNILFPILGYVEMILEDVPEDSPLRSHLEEVLTGAKRARDLVRQILTFSRQSDHEPGPLKIQLVIREAIKLIRSSMPSTIKISQYINNDCGLVMADPTHIHQIIMNLCTNAFHAMEETGGQLTVTLKEIELTIDDLKDPAMIPGLHACLVVTDTGCGMDQRLTNRIFDPYFTTKKAGKGTGLGLAVIPGIIKNYDGHISVYSEPGKGTEFRVYLPVIRSPKAAPKAETDSPIQKGNEHVLLVDDQNDIIQLEKKMLERLGYQVTVRISSTDALEAFKAAPDNFDLVITDMTMPNMTGGKLACELIKIRPGIPIILCTGFSEMMPEEKALSMGIKGFLMKPVIMKDLSQKIREVLDKNVCF